MSVDVAGYTYDTNLVTSPVSLDDLGLLLATLLWTDDADIDAMHTAWFKAVTLTVALWSQPYDPAPW